MLINTVILFLKDLLPIFILCCLIVTCVAPTLVSKQRIGFLFVMSALGILITFKLLPSMGDLIGGKGIEVIQTVEILLAYFFFVHGSSYMLTQKQLSKLQGNLMVLGIALFIVVKGSVFIVFLDSYFVNSESIRNIFTGLALGLGICLSFSALLYFFLLWFIKKERYRLTYFFWALFLSGQISQVVILLQQVDILQSSKALWDSENLVKDSSEYGHLLKSLFGYEASPSLELILLYGTSLFIFYLYFFINSPRYFNRSINRPKGS